MIYFTGMISLADEKLNALASAMGRELIEECLGVAKIRYFWIIIGQNKVKPDGAQKIIRQIDDCCLKPGCEIRDYTQICVVDIPFSKHPKEELFWRLWVEDNSEHIFYMVSRINKLKVFL